MKVDIYRIAKQGIRRLHLPVEADREDVLQVAAIAAHEALSILDNPTTARGLLRLVAYQAAVDYIRQQHGRGEKQRKARKTCSLNFVPLGLNPDPAREVDSIEGFAVDPTTPEGVLEARQTGEAVMAWLEEGLARLSPSRAALARCKLCGGPLPENLSNPGTRAATGNKAREGLLRTAREMGLGDVITSEVLRTAFSGG